MSDNSNSGNRLVSLSPEQRHGWRYDFVVAIEALAMFDCPPFRERAIDSQFAICLEVGAPLVDSGLLALSRLLIQRYPNNSDEIFARVMQMTGDEYQALQTEWKSRKETRS